MELHPLPIENRFTCSEEDYSLHIHEKYTLLILLYVDEMVLAATSRESIDWAKAALHHHFDMMDLRKLFCPISEVPPSANIH